jgi:hypothetical protein
LSNKVEELLMKGVAVGELEELRGMALSYLSEQMEE